MTPGERRRDDRGVTAVEFALLAPLLFILIIAVYDIAVLCFLSLSLERATLNAARLGATGLETSGMTRLEAVRAVIDDATLGLLDDNGLSVVARVYDDFAEMAGAEWLDDVDGDGVADQGEAFEDVNGNGVWDGDPGAQGVGGSGAIVRYHVTATYRPVTPIFGAAVGDVRMHAAAPVVNEPF